MLIFVTAVNDILVTFRFFRKQFEPSFLFGFITIPTTQNSFKVSMQKYIYF